MAIIKAPFNTEQVSNLKAWQTGPVHSFTCGNSRHPRRKSHLKTLVPYIGGWVCPGCGYRQYWAHDFMLDGSMIAAMKKMLTLAFNTK